MHRQLYAVLLAACLTVACGGAAPQQAMLTPSSAEAEAHAIRLIEPVRRPNGEELQVGVSVALSVSETGAVTAAEVISEPQRQNRAPADVVAEALTKARAATFEPSAALAVGGSNDPLARSRRRRSAYSGSIGESFRPTGARPRSPAPRASVPIRSVRPSGARINRNFSLPRRAAPHRGARSTRDARARARTPRPARRRAIPVPDPAPTR